MAKSVKQEWAVTTWSAKAGSGIEWKPIGEAISGIMIDAYGRQYRAINYVNAMPTQRRPYKTESDDTTGITYVMYDNDANGAVPVIRITEEEE